MLLIDSWLRYTAAAKRSSADSPIGRIALKHPDTVCVYSLWENKGRGAIQMEYWLAGAYDVKAILGK